MLNLQTSWSSSTRLPAEEAGCSTQEGCNGVYFSGCMHTHTCTVNRFVKGHPPIPLLVDTGSSVTLLHLRYLIMAVIGSK